MGALRDSIDGSDVVVVCDSCGFLALRTDCRDGRTVDPLLRYVCPICCDEFASAEDETYGAHPHGDW